MVDLSNLIARVISLIYVSTGIAVLVGTVDFNKIVDGLIKSQALTFIAGAVAIAGGVFMVEHHNLWVKDWRVIITLICWMFLAGGVIIIVYPKLLSTYNRLLKNSRLLGSFMLVFGMLMGYFGFFD